MMANRETTIHWAGKIAHKRDREPFTELKFENEILQTVVKLSMCMCEEKENIFSN